MTNSSAGGGRGGRRAAPVHGGVAGREGGRRKPRAPPTSWARRLAAPRLAPRRLSAAHPGKATTLARTALWRLRALAARGVTTGRRLDGSIIFARRRCTPPIPSMGPSCGRASATAPAPQPGVWNALLYATRRRALQRSHHRATASPQVLRRMSAGRGTRGLRCGTTAAPSNDRRAILYWLQRWTLHGTHSLATELSRSACASGPERRRVQK